MMNERPTPSRQFPLSLRERAGVRGTFMGILSALLLLLPLSAFSQTTSWTEATVTITNAANLTNALSTFSVNGTARTWTNNTGFSPSTTISWPNNGFYATTNLLQAYQLYRASGAGGPVFARTNATNAVKFIGTEGDTLTIAFSPNYCSVA